MPWRHRPDFKQAVSTLQRLQQEAGEEPKVPAHSYKHQQWEARTWTVCVSTPQMTRFRDAKVCNNWLHKRIEDHRIQSDYKYKSELQNPEGKKSVLGTSSGWGHRARHQ